MVGEVSVGTLMDIGIWNFKNWSLTIRAFVYKNYPLPAPSSKPKAELSILQPSWLYDFITLWLTKLYSKKKRINSDALFLGMS
jgi:hypothetical protein